MGAQGGVASYHYDGFFKAFRVVMSLTGWDDRPSSFEKLTSTTHNRNLGGDTFEAEYNMIHKHYAHTFDHRILRLHKG